MKVSVLSLYAPIPSNIALSDLYGPATDADKPTANGTANGAADSVKTRTVVHLSLCDSLPAHGPISDMTFGIARNGVSSAVNTYLPSLTECIHRTARSLS